MRNLVSHKMRSMPVLVLMPHSNCNCRCVMCDIWKANQNKKEISVEELEKHLESFQKLKLKEVALSGGEALMHSNLWRFCERLKSIQIKITLLSTGLLLSRNSNEVVDHIDEVIISLDGSQEVHNQIRNIPAAYKKLSDGVRSLKKLKQSLPVKGRSVLQKQNYHDFLNIVKSAKELGLDQISFLAADVSTDAFNRLEPWSLSKQSSIALDKEDCNRLERILKESFSQNTRDYQKKFIAESPEKMMNILQYYKALIGLADFPKQKCNAPWVSAVVESDGEVRPCFFHASYGNISEKSFSDVINSETAIAFRKNLNVEKNPICERCVCSLYISPIRKIIPLP